MLKNLTNFGFLAVTVASAQYAGGYPNEHNFYQGLDWSPESGLYGSDLSTKRSSDESESSDTNESQFMPMPGMLVAGSCQWDVRISKMTNRIPERIVEIYCRNQQNSCDNNLFYKVSQIQCEPGAESYF